MKLLVFGQSGQVAREIQRRLPTDMTATYLSRAQADLSCPEVCADAVSRSDADGVINAAAWTAVDQAETEEAAATVVNGDSPGAMARAAAAKHVPFLHVSTEYVFDGRGAVPYKPDDRVGPVNAYGRSKLAGERAIQAAGGNTLILRTSWVFSIHGSNFVKTILSLAKVKDDLNVIADQIGGPTSAASIADALIVAARAMKSGQAGGVHHFAGGPDVSRSDFARRIVERANFSCRVTDTLSATYPSKVQRPLNSGLDCASFTAAFDWPRPDWQAGLDDVVRELCA